MSFNIINNDMKVFYVPKLSMKHVSHLHIVTVYEFELEITLEWLLLTSNNLQFFLYCYYWVLCPQNRYTTCVTLIGPPRSQAEALKAEALIGFSVVKTSVCLCVRVLQVTVFDLGT